MAPARGLQTQTSTPLPGTQPSYGLRQEFITPHTPEQNGMVERVIRTLKEQCAHRHRFETLQHASRVIGDWISFYNHRRPHQALGMKTPAATFALAA
jgi:putative transposase